MIDSEHLGSTDKDAVDDVMQKDVNSDISLLSLGAQLAMKRQQLGWTTDDVAGHLKLASRQIEAMEADDYTVLPTMVMTRGYIRSYAKLLGVDPHSLLMPISSEITTELTAQSNLLSRSFPELSSLSVRRDRFPYKWFAIILVLVLLIAFIMIGKSKLFDWFDALTTKVVTQASTTVSIVPTSQNVNSKSLNPVELKASKPSSVNTTDSPISINLVDEFNRSSNSLNLHFRQDSWIEIRRADDSVVISRLVKAGSVESLEMIQPIFLVIGNVAGVDANLRGIPLDLKASTKTNVAKLNLK